MRRIITFLIVIAILLSFAACKQDTPSMDSTPDTTVPGTAPTTPPTPPQPTEPAVQQIEMQAYANRVYISPNQKEQYYYILHLSEDQTFQLTGSLYLSTFMRGFWAQEGQQLVLYCGSGKFYFQITESGFTFLRSRSDTDHVIRDLAEGALFTENLPTSEEIIATYYEASSGDTAAPIRLMLGSISGNEGLRGYYCFGNITVTGMEGKGEWEIRDDLLILMEPKLGHYQEKQYLYFQITENGFVFLPDQSDRWPLEAAWPEEGVLKRKTEESKAIVAELYTFQPAGSLHKFQLHLFDGFYYYLMSSAGGLEEGVCYTDGDMLILTSQSYDSNIQYCFRITAEGYVFQDKGSGDPNFFAKLEDQALFTTDQPERNPNVGAYYMLQTEGADFPARLYLREQNVFEFYGPDYSNQLYGEWIQENGILTVTATHAGGNPCQLIFRIEKDGVCFLAAQSDPIPEEFGLTDGVRLNLVAPGEAAPPATTPPTTPPEQTVPPTTDPPVNPTGPSMGDPTWGIFDGKAFWGTSTDESYNLDLYSDGTFKHRVSTAKNHVDQGIWKLEGDVLYLIGLDKDGKENGYISCFQYIPGKTDVDTQLVFIKGSNDLPNLRKSEDGVIYEWATYIIIP